MPNQKPIHNHTGGKRNGVARPQPASAAAPNGAEHTTPPSAPDDRGNGLAEHTLPASAPGLPGADPWEAEAPAGEDPDRSDNEPAQAADVQADRAYHTALYELLGWDGFAPAGHRPTQTDGGDGPPLGPAAGQLAAWLGQQAVASDAGGAAMLSASLVPLLASRHGALDPALCALLPALMQSLARWARHLQRRRATRSQLAQLPQITDRVIATLAAAQRQGKRITPASAHALFRRALQGLLLDGARAVEAAEPAQAQPGARRASRGRAMEPNWWDDEDDN
ncbi:MAG: hypothetical protein KJZ93_15605 [Caldilineaceae bacterium]|nr:hypothetical protein [Caldilineaceae bacterium]